MPDGGDAEVEGHAAAGADAVLDRAREPLQADVAGHDVGVGIGDADERLVELLAGDAARVQQRPGRRPLYALSDSIAAHDSNLR